MVAEGKTLLRVSASCDSPSRLPLFLDMLSAAGTWPPSRETCSWGDRSTSTLSQSSVLPLPKAQDLRKMAEQKFTSTVPQSSLGGWVCVRLFYPGLVFFFPRFWGKGFIAIWRAGVIKHISEGREMVSAEMSSSCLEQQLQMCHGSGRGGSEGLGLHFMSMDLCE